jgi:hypothetical protein
VGAGISLIRRHFLTRAEQSPGEPLLEERRDESYRSLIAAEPDHGVAESGDLTLPHAALVVPLVVGDVLMLDPALTLPPLQHHPDAADPVQLPLEALIEGGLALTDDEQQTHPGK